MDWEERGGQEKCSRKVHVGPRLVGDAFGSHLLEVASERIAGEELEGRAQAECKGGVVASSGIQAWSSCSGRGRFKVVLGVAGLGGGRPLPGGKACACTREEQVDSSSAHLVHCSVGGVLKPT